METSASFEARYAPLPYPTNHVAARLPFSGAEHQTQKLADLLLRAEQIPFGATSLDSGTSAYLTCRRINKQLNEGSSGRRIRCTDEQSAQAEVVH